MRSSSTSSHKQPLPKSQKKKLITHDGNEWMTRGFRLRAMPFSLNWASGGFLEHSELVI
jgi:hypothetical protein